MTGKHSAGSPITDEADVRRRSPDWLNYFRDGRPVAQGALAWLWARSPVLIPIPGARTVEQVQQNAAAMDHGPLTRDQMRDIQAIYQVETP